MVRGMAAAAAVVVMLAAGAAQAAAPAAPVVVPPSCDRACLEGFIDKYLAALAAKDPSRLPLVRGARYTENGAELKLGDGLWGTIERLGDYKLSFVDPDTQEAGVFATVKESGRQALLALRLQIQSGTKISQIEAMVARTTPGQGPFANLPPPTFTPKPVFYETVPPNERRSRAQMLAIAVSYFEGLEQATDKLTPFDPNCQRIENGMVTANNPASPAAMSKMTCGQQFATGFSPFITQIRERRFPIMDQEKGLALAQVFFDHAGVIKDGKIIRVEAVLNPVPYGMKSGW